MLYRPGSIIRKNAREDVMANPMIASGFGLGCADCGDTVIAPYWSQFVCKNQIRHFWICEGCGHHFDTTVEMAADVGGRRRKPASTEHLSAVA